LIKNGQRSHGLPAVGQQQTFRPGGGVSRRDVLRLASGMNAEVAKICADYPSDDLELIATFLRCTADAGRTAGAQLDAS
jgi:hypothetical protein